nr:MAG TPA: hypothetical protein [Caudoviricetes sp.]
MPSQVQRKYYHTSQVLFFVLGSFSTRELSNKYREAEQ